LVTRAVRTGINNIIRTAEYGSDTDLIDYECNKKDKKHRCPLGNCIDQSLMCNGYPDCLDASDENQEICKSHGPIKCAHMNATHCMCPSSGDMLCENQVCVSKLLFCDGKDDCGDGSDEPAGCKDDCSVGLAAGVGDKKKICDNVIDCLSHTDLGSDESVERCCQEPDHDYRCVLGKPQVSYDHGTKDDGSVGFTNTCINSTGVCDGDFFGLDSCPNGADEVDCIAIWPREEFEKDAFGRYMSRSAGFLTVIVNGRPFLYCANPATFNSTMNPTMLDDVGEAMCTAEGFAGAESTVQVPTDEKQTLKNVEQDFTPEVQQQFKDCFLIYITCQKSNPYQM